MSPEIILVLSLAVGMIVIFMLELLPVEGIGLLMIVALTVTGLVSPEEGISGFSNQAVITILALMIIGAALEETGAVESMGYRLQDLFSLPEWASVGLLMLIAGLVSAFINTTAVVIVFLSILLKIADKIPTNLSKLLMPLSFAGIMGGSCSLMGTSTNLLVSSISKNAGFEPFGFFEFTPIGLGIFAVAFVYMVLIGRHLLPQRAPKKKAEEDFSKKVYSTIIRVNEGSSQLEKPLHKTVFFQDGISSIIALGRGSQELRLPFRYEKLQVGDRLLIAVNAEKIKDLLENDDVTLLSEEDAEKIAANPRQFVLCEALIKPGSSLLGRRLKKIDLWREYNIVTIGVHQVKRTFDLFAQYFSPAKALNVYLKKDNLDIGDSLLVLVNKQEVDDLSKTRDFVLLREFRELHYETRKIAISLAVLATVVVLAATGVLPILVSALSGALVLALLGCISLSKAFRSINWNILFLLAGMIPVGIAMSNTGADKFLADGFVKLLPSREPIYVIGAMFLFTTLLTSIISNNATAILLAPIAISLAETLGFPPKPLLFAVMFGANTSYFTPIGYQTNTLIYNPGSYKFRDFALVGGLLTVAIVVVATFLIYWFAY